MLAHLFYTIQSLKDLIGSLKLEWNSHNTNGKCYLFLSSNTSHNWSHIGSGLPTQARNNDDHLGIIIKEGGDFGLALLCCMACYLVVIDCTLSLRRVSAQQHSVRNRRLFKLMPVSV